MKDYSQNGEQAHILHYLDTIGLTTGHLVDLGAGDGYTMSNSRALLDRGWTGDLYDGDPKGSQDVRKAWIDRGTVRGLMPTQVVDFLNLDIDGNDFHILKEIFEHGVRPALIVCEINPIFERYAPVTMPYNASHQWDGTDYYGMSLCAAERLGDRYGYTLAYLHAGINAFLLRNDHAKAYPELVRAIDYRIKQDHRRDPHDRPWTTLR